MPRTIAEITINKAIHPTMIELRRYCLAIPPPQLSRGQATSCQATKEARDIVAQVKNNSIKTLPRGRTLTGSVDRGETGAKEASEAIPTAWLGAVYDRVMETLDWVNEEPFDNTYCRNMALMVCNWANPVRTKVEHRIPLGVVKRYVRQRLTEEGRPADGMDVVAE